ncbi:MAG: hypothetical protein LW630_11485, partial [Saprospiraceae bacterium]|nr:hypothetical protein [Saprospiraceae bacterium]
GANLTINRDRLLERRNGLLQKLLDRGIIQQDEYHRNLSEPLPKKQLAITQQAYHLLNHLSKTHANTYVYLSTISPVYQHLTRELLLRESEFLRQEDIRNLALVVLDTEQDCVVAYHGNVPKGNGSFSYVDIAQSPRSTGSLLKPLLYLHVLESGLMLPQEMVPDIPSAFGDFQPQNFDKKFRGVVGLDEMVIQSLNVPAVRVLQQAGLHSFYEKLQQLKIGHLNKGADHYGLSLILGGGETSLWEICRIYKGISRNAAGKTMPFGAVRILKDHDPVLPLPQLRFSQGPLDHTIRVMSDVKRPREDKHWSVYGNRQEVAWKTGTSYGHKDGWAVGFNGKFLVGVWVGNEDGEGRFDLTGISRAAPVMFQVFRSLPESRLPAASTAKNQQKVKVCRHSGKRAGPLCTDVGEVGAQGLVLGLDVCQWHQIAEINAQGKMVGSGCPSKVAFRDTIFVLPAWYEYYYKAGHPEYVGLPDTDPKCQSTAEGCQIMYPREGMTIFLPRKDQNLSNELILEAYHRREDAQLYWYDNQIFLGKTNHGAHRLSATLQPGKHQLTILDNWGNQSKVSFLVVH